ncbi:Ltp family lipoprotein [Bifidobacterium sp. ESL0790]|uniref:Ltp family lipoprotein n=1 Tax=Bifidobacterium sp. ESL0790 TaxID=2983233 RepID=UPI0023F6E1B1|nr:Ltp family lipoprotein [Bifidobacterium sp. ESL0790]WEV72915.1 Ltp family lipoprotein [Bifidobacterium sp. ESL0790]
MPDSPQPINGQNKFENDPANQGVASPADSTPAAASQTNVYAQAASGQGGATNQPAGNSVMPMTPDPFPVVPTTNGNMGPLDSRRARPERLSAGGVTALVLGIIGTVLSFIPIVNNAAAILGVIGVVFGVIGLVGVFRGKKRGKGLTIAGTVLSVIAIVVTLGMQSATGKAMDSASRNASSSTSQQQAKPQASQQQKSKVPVEYTNALASAKTYSDTMHMSKQGIYDQLTSPAGDKFSPEAAQYAVDNLQADYNANALASAKQYEETMQMSPEAIREQLTSPAGDKFTDQEADYAVQHLDQ